MRRPTFRLPPVSPAALAVSGLAALASDLAIVALLLGVAVARGAPPQDLPWTPLRLDAPVGLATGVKFERAAADPLRCRAALAEGGVRFVEAEARTDGACTTRDTVRLQGELLQPRAPLMTCRQALAFSFWVRHGLQPAARAELGEPVTRIDHYGTYACRNIYGRATGVRSQHAYADAIDVAGLHTASGRRITVARDFRDEDDAGRFLRRARDGACNWYASVLSPDYNAAHADHLHLDRGRWKACR
ncbi:MAG: extensin family protein [Phenylobacterium zucineum]|nr:MAG: extensin family protein [Phenylobacterium zucineum]